MMNGNTYHGLYDRRFEQLEHYHITMFKGEVGVIPRNDCKCCFSSLFVVRVPV